jgi:organic radical activating enzyme
MIVPKIIWQISGGCSHSCWYCLPKYRNNPDFRPLDDYLYVIDKLQNHGDRIKFPKMYWKFNGGEPLQFPNFNIILRQVKSKDSIVKIETSGEDNWFALLEVIDYLNAVELTHHYWQNQNVLNYIIDLSKERNIDLKIKIPMLPGKMRDCIRLSEELKAQGNNVDEILLVKEDSQPLNEYSMLDFNLFNRRPEDWVPPPPPSPTGWVDPRVDDGAPSYTGKPCYAGVDYIYISSKGFTNSSDCNGRMLGNVFESGWLPADTPFPCPMMFCRSNNDHNNIRIPK